MHPIGRLIGYFDPECEANDDGANDENDKYRRAIAGIFMGQLQTTDVTTIGNLEESIIEFALAAARTAASQTSRKRRDKAVMCAQDVSISITEIGPLD